VHDDGLTAQLCRMARAALKMDVRELASLADVSPNTIARLERGERLHRRTLRFIRGVLEAQGINFISMGAVSMGGGAGVRIGDGPKTSYGALFAAIYNVPDLRQQPGAAFQSMVDIIERYLDIVQKDGREPDTWERLDLNDALNALKRSDVFSAAAYITHAITPPDNQSPDYPISAATAKTVADLDLDYFRLCLTALRSRGYAFRAHPATR
jgi:transcriptional regulator with XRE-family HTH domain